MPRASGRSGNTASKQEGAEEATSGRKRRGAAAQAQEEEVKLTPEEIYEMELAEAKERNRQEAEEKRAMLLAK